MGERYIVAHNIMTLSMKNDVRINLEPISKRTLKDSPSMVFWATHDS